MPAFIPVITAVSGVVGTVAAVKSARAQKKAASANAAAREQQQRQQEVAARRSRRQAIRRSQIARSELVAGAAAVGGGTSSGAAGGMASIGAQLGSGLGYASQQSAIGRNVFGFQQQALQYGAQAQQYANIGGIANGLFSFGAQQGGLDWMFPQQGVNRPQVPNYTTG